MDGSHIRIPIRPSCSGICVSLWRRGTSTSPCRPSTASTKKNHKGENDRFAFTDEERDRIIAEIGGSVEADRYKGLGEMDDHELRETTMDPS